MNDHEHLNVTVVDGVTVVRCVDSRIMDAYAVQKIKDEWAVVTRDRENLAVVLNLANVEFCGSAFIGSLLMLNGNVKAAHGRLVLCNLSPELQEIFRIVGIYKLIDVKASEAEAVDAVRSGAA